MECGCGRAARAGYFFGKTAERGLSRNDAAPFHAGRVLQRVRGAACQGVRIFTRGARTGNAARRNQKNFGNHRNGVLRAGRAVHHQLPFRDSAIFRPSRGTTAGTAADASSPAARNTRSTARATKSPLTRSLRPIFAWARALRNMWRRGFRR